MKTPESEVIAAAKLWAETVPLSQAHELPQELLSLWVSIRRMKYGGIEPRPLAKCSAPRAK